MNKRKIISMILMLVAILLATSIVVVHSVAAANSNEAETTNNDKKDSENNNKFDQDLLIFVSIIIVGVIILAGVYLNIKKAEPLNPEPRVEPLFEPFWRSYEYDSWGSSDGTWSKTNDAWEPQLNEPSPEYGSYDQQSRTLYGASESKY